MKYENMIWSYNTKKIKDENTLYLDKNDISHLNRIYLKYSIKPETLNEVRLEYLLEDTKLARYIIKESDILLKVNGKFVIKVCKTKSLEERGIGIRSLSFIMYEFSMAVKERYKVISKRIEKEYILIEAVKLKPTLKEDDKIENWSFGIISNGKKNDQVMKIISQIYDQNIPNFEIIICGPSPVPQEKLPQKVKIIKDIVSVDIRAPIARKKNKIIDSATYNNLVIVHDRIEFPSDWYEKITSYGNYFEILCTPVMDVETKSMRVLDWITYERRVDEYKRFFNSRMLMYSEWSPEIYVGGGYIIIKTDIAKRIKYEDSLHWAELEDVHLGKKLYLQGYLTNICLEAYVTTLTHRHGGIKKVSNWNRYEFKRSIALAIKTIIYKLKLLSLRKV